MYCAPLHRQSHPHHHHHHQLWTLQAEVGQMLLRSVAELQGQWLSLLPLYSSSFEDANYVETHTPVLSTVRQPRVMTAMRSCLQLKAHTEVQQR
jgi:hypothetical protein